MVTRTTDIKKTLTPAEKRAFRSTELRLLREKAKVHTHARKGVQTR